MRLFLTVVTVLTVTVIIAVIAHNDPGYLIINYRDWVIESSVVLGMVVLFLGFTIIYFLIRMYSSARHFPQRLKFQLNQRQANLSSKTLTNGLLELSKGDWIKAEKLLLKNIDRSRTPLINYLAAARAAQEQNNDQRRDVYIQQAYKVMPKADLSIGVTHAELQVTQGQYEQALATLTRLRRQYPKNDSVLKLLLRSYVELQDWERLLELLPILIKRKILAHDKAVQLEVMGQLALLTKAGAEKDPQVLRDAWLRVNKSTRQISVILQRYIEGLMQHGLGNEAEAIINQALDRAWDQELVRLYGMLTSTDVSRQIRYAEDWFSQHNKDPVLMLTLGRLCMRNKLWAQARQYFESSLSYELTAETCTELAKLLEQHGENEKALAYYRTGLQLTTTKPTLTLN